jgi:predicted nucleotide-binding protein (sugar kinase/HSP70/actin superfamily)
MSYNLDESISNNHYNCPVVAYYPEVIGISVPDIKKTDFIQCFIDLNNKKAFNKKIWEVLRPRFPAVTASAIAKATEAAHVEYKLYMEDIRAKGREIVATAQKRGMDVVALCGRPYHADPEVNHGIPALITAMDKAVISEDCLPLTLTDTSVLNQWTYHARMYSAAKYILSHKHIHLVQLVSFGCGLDAVTSDEVRRQLEAGGRLYTQLKIDEITNLGAVKIRLKSLFAALKQDKTEAKSV